MKRFLCLWVAALAAPLLIRGADDAFVIQKQLENDDGIILVRRASRGVAQVPILNKTVPLYTYTISYQTVDGQDHVLGGMPNYQEPVMPGSAEFRISSIKAVASLPDGSIGVLLGGSGYSMIHLLFNKSDPERTIALSEVRTVPLELRRPGFKLVSPGRIEVTLNDENSNVRKTHEMALRGDHMWTFDGNEFLGVVCLSVGGKQVMEETLTSKPNFVTDDNTNSVSSLGLSNNNKASKSAKIQVSKATTFLDPNFNWQGFLCGAALVVGILVLISVMVRRWKK